MNAHLIFRDRNYDPEQILCADHETLEKDLGINFILDGMAAEDDWIRSICRQLLFSPLKTQEEIGYRQDALRDAMAHPAVVRELYQLCVEAEELRRKSWSWLNSAYISGTFSAALSYLSIYLNKLSRLKSIAEQSGSDFSSAAFSGFFTELRTELSDDYLKETIGALRSLRDIGSLPIRARLGSFLQGTDYMLCRSIPQKFSLRRHFAPVYKIRGDDHAAQEDLSMRQNRAINELTNALAQAAEHLLAYFNMLRTELAFYVGCLNLRDALEKKGLPICIPVMLPIGSRSRRVRTLYDGGVALTKGSADGNTLGFDEADIYLITGANQGGKSTFLRSVGQHQLMAQSGMFVFAEEAEIPMRNALFTHFKKEEDDKLESGKLDEELARMSHIIDLLEPDSVVLFNESFAATNEREGSEISRQIISTLIGNGIEVFAVSHMMNFVESYLQNPRAVFLQAERLDDGTRTHRILAGKPTLTAYGMDIYNEVFGASETS